MTVTDAPAFGTLLQRYRLAAGLSQEALAERAGVSARALSDLERGRRQAPYPHTVRQLALLAGEDAGPWHLARNLDGLAAVAAARGWQGCAARLLGIADGVWRPTFAREPEQQRAFEETAGAAAAALGEAAFEAARAEGQAMAAAEAIASALAEESAPADTATAPPLAAGGRSRRAAEAPA
jgi:transcriptional regulator with XRE-family HTH domain